MKQETKQIIPDYCTTKYSPLSFTVTDRGDHGDNSAHSHEFVEIVYIVSGHIKHSVGKDTIREIKEGTLFYVFPETEHGYFRDDNSYCAHRDIIINTEVFKETCDFLEPTLFNKFKTGSIPYYTQLSTEKVSRFERRIETILSIPPTLSDKRLILMKALLVELIQCFISTEIKEQTAHLPSWFKDLLANFDKIQYLQQGLKKITEEFKYDQKYLCHVFKKHMGITMTEHLNNCRLSHAMHMLQYTDESILNISINLGFSSVSYFSIVFKNKYGFSPSKARTKTSQKRH